MASFFLEEDLIVINLLITFKKDKKALLS